MHSWYMICKLQPGAPVDPYVAIKRTVALQMVRIYMDVCMHTRVAHVGADW